MAAGAMRRPHRPTRDFAMTPIVRIGAFVFSVVIGAAFGDASAATTLCADLRDWRDDGAAAPLHWRTGEASAQIADSGTRVFVAALISPVLDVPAGGLSLSWRQRRELSWANSAGVLDVSVDDGAWSDVTVAGARFDEGDYDARSFAGNPLGVRRAWGSDVSVSTVRLELPAALAQRTIRLRFRFGSGGTGDAKPGWLITDLRCESGR
jgi:hypothetical protein